MNSRLSIDANDIGVAVENGVVTLTGYVPNFSQKSAVERAVLRIKGVKGIAEEIEVRFHQGAGSADDEIARRSIDMLKWSTLVPEGKVLAELKRRTRLAAHSKAVARSRLVLGGNGRLVFEKRHDAEVGSSISSILRMKGSLPPLSIAGVGCTRRRSLAPIATTGFGSSWKGVQRLLCARRGHRASIGWARSLHLSSDGER